MLAEEAFQFLQVLVRRGIPLWIGFLPLSLSGRICLPRFASGMMVFNFLEFDMLTRFGDDRRSTASAPVVSMEMRGEC
jgi:hypothetical protein